MRSPFSTAESSQPSAPDHNPAGADGTPDTATPGEIDDSLERARSYALLWLLMRDENLRRAEEIDRDSPTFG